jgi:hypothetical protein
MKKFTGGVLAGIAIAAAVAAWMQLGSPWGARGQKQEVLDPARIELIRTPGGFLQVGSLAKVEEFGWRTSWECPLVDCSQLPRTVSRIRVKAHYVYRIPLAAQWRLVPEGDHYRLTVPPVQLQRPVAFDTGSLEIVTTEQSVFSPAAAPNRENTVRHLGPELAQRGASDAYLDAQRADAEQTVREFARKWMLEQGKNSNRRIEVVFNGPDPQ